ncbi:MAG: hypothetical protein LBC85_08680 [Fibromonadaceae bacterium]|jgi:hypothetical protein|nr:hypothetical protein [Fibromonadaceae bacterium]
MSVIDLNGDWKILWDADGKGVVNRWFAEIPSKAKNIKIPHFWSENPASTAFYYKKFSLSDKDRRCVLRFEQAAVYAVIWVNGRLVSDHFGSGNAFEFDISQFVKTKNENLLCIKISTASANGDFEFISGAEPVPAEQMPLGLPWNQYPFAGLTGNVSLLTGDKALLTALEIATDSDNGYINLKISLNNPRNYLAKLKIFVRNTKQEVTSLLKEIKLEKENAVTTLQLGFKEVVLWSLDKPNLYAVEVQLEGSNSLVSNFGFRKFDCKQGDFLLNDFVIKIRGIVYSQHSAKGGVWGSDLEATQKDLKSIKDMGFNAVRTGGTPFSSEVLDICDKLGLLVFQEFPICDQQSSKMGLEAIKAMALEIIRASINHPSLAVWVLGQDNGRLILENGAKLLSYIDSLESCHPAISNINNVSIDNDQNFEHGNERAFGTTGKIMGVTDGSIMVYSSHRLSLKTFCGVPFSLFLSRYGISEDEDFIIPDPFFGDAWIQDNYKQLANEIKKNGHVLLTLKNHNLFGAAKDNEAIQDLSQKIKKFLSKEKGIWANVEAFTKNSNELAMRGFEQNVQALQSSPVVSGYFIEQWADCKKDLSGIVDESRKSKNLETIIKTMNSPTKLLISGLERVVATTENISFQLSLLNENRLAEINVSAQLLDESGKAVVAQSKNFPLQKLSLVSLGDFSIKTPKKNGSYSLKLSLIYSGKEISSVEEPVEIIDIPDIKGTLAKSEFLDAAENSAEIMKMITGKKPVLFTAALSSWADSSILESVAEAVRNGKILFISDIIPEDVKLLNTSSFECSIEHIYSSGANGASMHYVPKDSPLASSFFGKSVLDKTCSALMPGMSLLPLKNAQCLVNSISIKQGELQSGTNLQIMPFGKGKVIFSTLNFEGLETYALTNSIFAEVVKLALA